MSDLDSSRLRIVTWTLAFACGASVANLYYAQPLLDLIARSFHVSQGSAAVVVTMTQLGYALGLALLLPLGDLLENRALACRTLVVTALALVLAASAPGLGVFLIASVLVGVTSVVAQVLIPLAAHFAPPDQRGRFVGQVMSGLLLGILLARSAASLLAAVWGWRSIFIVSAGLMLVTSLVLRRVLPARRPDTRAGYGTLLASAGRLVRVYPLLRWRALAQGAMFAAFSAFWTAIAFQLVDVHHFSQTGIALFALVGASGAAAAPLAGRLGDRGHGYLGRVIAAALAAVSMAIAAFSGSSVLVLGACGVVLDLAVQGHQVLGQRDIYGLDPTARARITAVYMTTVFLGGAAASAVTGWVHQSAGWKGAALVGAGAATLATLLSLFGPRTAKAARPADAPAAPVGEAVAS